MLRRAFFSIAILFYSQESALASIPKYRGEELLYMQFGRFIYITIAITAFILVLKTILYWRNLNWLQLFNVVAGHMLLSTFFSGALAAMGNDDLFPELNRLSEGAANHIGALMGASFSDELAGFDLVMGIVLFSLLVLFVPLCAAVFEWKTMEVRDTGVTRENKASIVATNTFYALLMGFFAYIFLYDLYG